MSLVNLDLELLRTFVAIVERESFAAAADSVHRTQSAVTRRLYVIGLVWTDRRAAKLTHRLAAFSLPSRAFTNCAPQRRRQRRCGSATSRLSACRSSPPDLPAS
ncbi:LysR family transcriptional regulator [Paraburkholderia xenovorans]|uniref:LysR family transcriptional regulator n=1 Tax=Paraburkholderia xenovorans TaxID=36873 RepID=UPI0038B7DF77